MKRALSILLVLVLSLSSFVFAAGETLDFDLSVDGKNAVTVPKGSIVTVTFKVTNPADAEEYNINSIQNEIKFDESFFSFVANSLTLTNPEAKGGLKEKFAGKRVYMNDKETTYTKEQLVGTFNLKVIAESGSGKVESTEILAYNENGGAFSVRCTDLTVTIGDGSGGTGGGEGAGNSGNGGGGGGGTTQKHTITFKTTDGIELGRVEKASDSTVDLSKHKYHKEGYTFEGWYTDKELTDKVTSIKLTADVTLYANWVVGTNAGYHPEILTTEHYAYIMGRDGGLICPQENITRAEVATIFFRLLTEDVRKESLTKENVFSDVAASEWYNTAISTLTQLEILNGRTESSFEPDAYITRAEFTTIAGRFSDGVYVGEDYFTDTDGHWAKEYINTAASLGWIVGENGIFRPDDNITRAEVMTLVNRVLNRIPESNEDLLDDMTRWVDNADASAWYYLAVQEATNSHNYEMKADGVHEKWTVLTENPNWAEFE